MPKNPINYSKTYIYKLVCKDPNITDKYVGHTTDPRHRKSRHKCSCNNPNGKDYNLWVYQFIRANGGWDNWEMIIIQCICCIDAHDARTHERRCLDELKATLNGNTPSRTLTEYYIDNKDVIIEKNKKYREKNRDVIAEKNKQYYEQNRDVIAEQKHQYYEQNRDIFCSKNKQYREQNRDVIAEQKHQYYEQNRDKITQYREQNRDVICKVHKQYYEKNKEVIAEKYKQYYEQNRDEINRKKRERRALKKLQSTDQIV
jgi:hypothetical protein